MRRILDCHDQPDFLSLQPSCSSTRSEQLITLRFRRSQQSSSLSLLSSPRAFGGSSILSPGSMRTRSEALAVYLRMRSVNSLVRERWISGKVPLIGATWVVSKIQSFDGRIGSLKG